jgi:hypothetical protein
VTVGDRDAVAVMGQILREKESELGMSHGEMIRQLEKVYGFDLDAAVNVRRISQYLGPRIVFED